MVSEWEGIRKVVLRAANVISTGNDVNQDLNFFSAGYQNPFMPRFILARTVMQFKNLPDFWLCSKIMKPLLLLFLALMLFHPLAAQTNHSATYDECINHYRQLDKKYANAKLTEAGKTDIGKPLHGFIISSDGDFNPESIHLKNRPVVMILNGIHPGEPDGIDASMMLADTLLSTAAGKKLLGNTVLLIIPSYNVDGMLNRGCCSRANQDGPEEYGFRGNARNLDLNRDFIKCDTENARSFTRLFREWNPHVLMDTHVSDGADYAYTMTLISTQHNKLHPLAGNFLKQTFTPALFNSMKAKGDEMIPYVNTRSYGDDPETGLFGFLETPRYATGYAALFNTLGFVAESHMLKPFPQRVQSTYRLLVSLLENVESHAEEIVSLKRKADSDCAAMKMFGLKWDVDTAKFDTLLFRGYEIRKEKSKVTGQPRIRYDRNAPFERPILFYDYFHATVSVQRPEYYLLPQAWKEVIERMKLNNVKMIPLSKDSTLQADVLYMDKYKATSTPYEGHYMNTALEVRTHNETVKVYRGDYLVPVNQTCNRYIVETLEPQAADSWFTWGFFDAILQQKEWFSDYVFEDLADSLLKTDQALRDAFYAKQQSDTVFAKDAFAQLYFIYQRSPYFEKTNRKYPVMRIR